MIILISFLVLLPLIGAAQKASFHFGYQVQVRKLPQDAQSLRLIMPVPQSGKYQSIENLRVKTNQSYNLKKEPRFGNRYLQIGIKEGQIPKRLDIKMTFDVRRKAIESSNGYKQGSENLQRYVKPDSLIPLNSTIRKEASQALNGTQETRKTKARAFYNHLINTMTYDKSGKGWGRGDAMYACNAKEGNCTDFHSLFMGMCRTQKIPTRFNIGFPIPKKTQQGKIKGYHCWAEFFLADQGWMPVDISEAWKHKNKRDYYFGNLDPHRVRFTSGRDIPIQIKPGKTKQLNYFIYPKVFVDGQPYNQVDTRFTFKYHND